MNKTKIVLAAAGGVIALGVLVTAYFTWSAFAAKTAAFEGDDENEGLSTYVDRVVSLTGKKPFPSKANKERIEKNRQTVEDWRTEARKAASVGDWCADANCTPAQFKEGLVRDAKRIVSLPGTEAGCLMKSDFGFGPFKPYLGDTLPAKDQLAKLQRQWYDITSLIDVLVTNGVTQVTDLQVVTRKAEADEKSKAKTKTKAKRKDEPQAGKGPSVETYKVTFVASPAAFVDIVRQLSFQERFTTVDGFEFAHERDRIFEAMGGELKKNDDTAASGGRRGRRRGGRDAEPKAEDKAKEKRGAVVFDPETDAAFKVDLTVSVCDFRTLEDDNEKGEAK